MEHLAIILDGNRRYAIKCLKDQKWGHFEGANRVEDLIGWVTDMKIPILTIYALSLKNMKRPGSKYIYDLLADRLKKAAVDERIHNNEVWQFVFYLRYGIGAVSGTYNLILITLKVL